MNVPSTEGKKKSVTESSEHIKENSLGQWRMTEAKTRDSCHICHEQLGTEFIKLREYKFHRAHFKCVECDTLLEGKKFYWKQNALYCSEHFVAKFCHTCRVCNEKIDSGRVIPAFGFHYHPHHFVCSTCSKPFNTERYYENNLLPYCEEHLMCCACSQQVKDQEMARVQTRVYHKTCLRCVACGASLMDSKKRVFLKEGKMYCEEDYLDAFSRWCTACGKHILKDCVSANEESFHLECLKCFVCHLPITSYICAAGYLRCESHIDVVLPPPRCAVCVKTIEDEVVSAIGGLKLHPQCFNCSHCGKPLTKSKCKYRDGLVCGDCLFQRPRTTHSSNTLDVKRESSVAGSPAPGANALSMLVSPSLSPLYPPSPGSAGVSPCPLPKSGPSPLGLSLLPPASAPPPPPPTENTNSPPRRAVLAPPLPSSPSMILSRALRKPSKFSFNTSSSTSTSTEGSVTSPTANPLSPSSRTPLSPSARTPLSPSARPPLSPTSRTPHSPTARPPPPPPSPTASRAARVSASIQAAGSVRFSPPTSPSNRTPPASPTTRMSSCPPSSVVPFQVTPPYSPAMSARVLPTPPPSPSIARSFSGTLTGIPEAPSFIPPPQLPTACTPELSATSVATSSLGHCIRWKRGKLLAGGGSGRVYEATDVDTGEVMALKQVKFKNPDQISQLNLEIELMRELKHPNIIRLIGLDRDEAKVNILMEFVDGRSVSDVLETRGAFAEDDIKKYIRQLLMALEYCHASGVVHRDIKGKNILLHSTGELKLADFGSAERVHSERLDPSLYNYTPLWTAPELPTGRYDTKVDIWSVGCVVIEMASAKPPWAEMKFENQFRALYHIGHTQSLPRIPDTLSEQGQDFVLLCLRREASCRPTASALLAHPWLNS